MVDHLPFEPSDIYARKKDRDDPLKTLKDEFIINKDTIYMDGNSLGLISKSSQKAVLNAMEEWENLMINGWLQANPAWFYAGEELGRRQAPLIGASPGEVVAVGTTTVNIHSLLATFYSPLSQRNKILADDLNFPSDLYALKSFIKLFSLDPDEHLILAKSKDGKTIDEDEIVSLITDDVGIVFLPSVFYRSGQLLDMGFLTKEAHKRGALIGFDCCHSVGVIPHRFSEWGVDFAVWCTYKYLNSGPGGVASLYVSRNHLAKGPGLYGWWGYRKDKQFNLSLDFEPAEDAGAWQISTPSIIALAALRGSLEIFETTNIKEIRKKSLELTGYLISLADELVTQAPYSYNIGTPREPNRRGGHVAIEHKHAYQICQALKERKVIVDFRPPNVIRIAPVALYTTFMEVWQTVQHLKEIIDTDEWQRFPSESGLVT